MKPLHGKHHQVFIDNYFSMVPLMEYLLRHQVYCCGTICSGRKYLTKELENWEDIAKRGIWLTCFRWRISVLQVERQQSCDIAIQFSWNGISNGLTNTKRWKKNQFQLPRCVAIKDYNTYMGVVLTRQICWCHDMLICRYADIIVWVI